jgi:hypothetical protein
MRKNLKKKKKKKKPASGYVGQCAHGITGISTPSALPWVGAYSSKAMLVDRRLLAYLKVKLQHMSVTTLMYFEDSMSKIKHS